MTEKMGFKMNFYRIVCFTISQNNFQFNPASLPGRVMSCLEKTIYKVQTKYCLISSGLHLLLNEKLNQSIIQYRTAFSDRNVNNIPLKKKYFFTIPIDATS